LLTARLNEIDNEPRKLQWTQALTEEPFIASVQ
jgi:ribosomal protein L24E